MPGLSLESGRQLFYETEIAKAARRGENGCKCCDGGLYVMKTHHLIDCSYSTKVKFFVKSVTQIKRVQDDDSI